MSVRHSPIYQRQIRLELLQWVRFVSKWQHFNKKTAARIKSLESFSEYTQQSARYFSSYLAPQQICWVDAMTDDIYSWQISHLTEGITGEELLKFKPTASRMFIYFIGLFSMCCVTIITLLFHYSHQALSFLSYRMANYTFSC